MLDRSTGSNDQVLHVVVPETKVDQVAQEPRADHLEVAREHTASIQHGRVGLETTHISLGSAIVESLTTRSNRGSGRSTQLASAP